MQKIIILFVLFFSSFILKGEEKNIRIVSLSPAVTEIICHLGGEKSLVGRSSVCDYPERIKKLPVAGDFARPDMERILSLRPDYLLSNDLINPSVINQLKFLGIRCVMKQASSAEDYFYWVHFAGKILKKEKAAVSEIRRVKKILAEIRKNAEKYKIKKKILWVIWDSPVMVAGKDSLPAHAVKYAGGINVAGEVRREYFKASPEWIIKSDPDFIVFLGLQQKKQLLLSGKYPWNSLKAWKEGKIICDLPEDLLLRPGPRFFTGVFLLHKAIYGEKF